MEIENRDTFWTKPNICDGAILLFLDVYYFCKTAVLLGSRYHSGKWLVKINDKDTISNVS